MRRNKRRSIKNRSNHSTALKTERGAVWISLSAPRIFAEHIHMLTLYGPARSNLKRWRIEGNVRVNSGWNNCVHKPTIEKPTNTKFYLQTITCLDWESLIRRFFTVSYLIMRDSICQVNLFWICSELQGDRIWQAAAGKRLTHVMGVASHRRQGLTRRHEDDRPISNCFSSWLRVRICFPRL